MINERKEKGGEDDLPQKKNHDIRFLLLIIKHLKKVKGRTRFQKVVYLLKEKYGLEMFYKFMPYYYGPYSDDLQSDIDILSRLGIISVETVSLSEGRVLYVHTLTDKGKRLTNKIEKEMPNKQIKQLQSALNELNNLETEDLVKSAKEDMKNKFKYKVFFS